MFGEASDDLASVDHEEELKQGQADLRLIDEALNGYLAAGVNYVMVHGTPRWVNFRAEQLHELLRKRANEHLAHVTDLETQLSLAKVQKRAAEIAAERAEAKLAEIMGVLRKQPVTEHRAAITFDNPEEPCRCSQCEFRRWLRDITNR